MSDFAIQVQSLGKRYRIGHRQPAYRTLRDSLSAAARSLFRNGAGKGSSADVLWALRDVSFEVQRGEVVGLIGRNGAGKSTLLKILSRITEPTEGRARIAGRVGSLLEVGTGFHPELTGRENIYLNGAILGMRRVEIARKLDDIVAFAEVERFIDTPVKHYSTGMYLRLAFAVAAHLDPEILLVDEVLAVGDAAFQDRCLSRMQDIAGHGRTVLFVSHNLNAVSRLCGAALLLDGGRIAFYGPADAAIRTYLGQTAHRNGTALLNAVGPGIRLISVAVEGADGFPRSVFRSSEDIHVVFELEIDQPTTDLGIGFDLTSDSGVTVLRSYQNDPAPGDWPPVRPGPNRLHCRLPAGLLNAGAYHVCPRIGEHCKRWLLHLDHVLSFEVTLSHGSSPFWVALDGKNRPGVIAPILTWQSR
jgi:lipopolysaccharide transport system ATP-binding protein